MSPRPRIWTDDQEHAVETISTSLDLLAQQLRVWQQRNRLVRPSELTELLELAIATRDEISTLKPRFRN